MGTNRHRGKILVCGVGYNDVDAATQRLENGKLVVTPHYGVWKKMFDRCYNPKHVKAKNYIGCTVHPDWHRFSKFKEWVDTQPQTDWQDLQIDKDLLVKGNKVYGPDTCCFLTRRENSVFKPSATKLGSIGYYKKRKKPWQARVWKNGKDTYFGVYSTKEEADIVAFRVTLKSVIDLANANPHQFIREAMMRWVDEWKQELLLRESAFQKLGEQNNGTLQDHLC
jgi:hypothetical protein